MASLKLLSIAGKFMLHVDSTTCGDGRENYFEIVSSTGDNIIHPGSLLVSSKSGSESDQIWIVKVIIDLQITGLQIFPLLIISSFSSKMDLMFHFFL